MLLLEERCSTSWSSLGLLGSHGNSPALLKHSCACSIFPQPSKELILQSLMSEIGHATYLHAILKTVATRPVECWSNRTALLATPEDWNNHSRSLTNPEVIGEFWQISMVLRSTCHCRLANTRFWRDLNILKLHKVFGGVGMIQNKAIWTFAVLSQNVSLTCILYIKTNNFYIIKYHTHILVEKSLNL